MNSITRKIEELETDSNVGLMVNKDAVLEIVKDAIAFEIEPHGDVRDRPESEGELLMWEALDTAVRVIALGAAKANLYALRQAVGEENVHTDEELVEEASRQLGYPASLAHVGVVPEEAAKLIHRAFIIAFDATADQFRVSGTTVGVIASGTTACQ